MIYNLNDLVIPSRQLNSKVFLLCHCYVNLPKVDLNLSFLKKLSVFLSPQPFHLRPKQCVVVFLQCLVSVLEALFVSDTNNGSWIAHWILIFAKLSSFFSLRLIASYVFICLKYCISTALLIIYCEALYLSFLKLYKRHATGKRCL